MTRTVHKMRAAEVVFIRAAHEAINLHSDLTRIAPAWAKQFDADVARIGDQDLDGVSWADCQAIAKIRGRLSARVTIAKANQKQMDELARITRDPSAPTAEHKYAFRQSIAISAEMREAFE